MVVQLTGHELFEQCVQLLVGFSAEFIVSGEDATPFRHQIREGCIRPQRHQWFHSEISLSSPVGNAELEL